MLHMITEGRPVIFDIIILVRGKIPTQFSESRVEQHPQGWSRLHGRRLHQPGHCLCLVRYLQLAGTVYTHDIRAARCNGDRIGYLRVNLWKSLNKVFCFTNCTSNSFKPLYGLLPVATDMVFVHHQCLDGRWSCPNVGGTGLVHHQMQRSYYNYAKLRRVLGALAGQHVLWQYVCLLPVSRRNTHCREIETSRFFGPNWSGRSGIGLLGLAEKHERIWDNHQPRQRGCATFAIDFRCWWIQVGG